MVAAAKSVANVTRSGSQSDDLRMIGRASAAGVCSGKGPHEAYGFAPRAVKKRRERVVVLFEIGEEKFGRGIA